jgi:hypothetical protein
MQIVTEIVFHGFAQALAVCDFAVGHSYLVVPSGRKASVRAVMDDSSSIWRFDLQYSRGHLTS